MINTNRFNEYIGNIKNFFKEYRTFKDIKNKIIITKDEIRINNIDTQKILNKSKFMGYLTKLSQKFSIDKIVFNCCTIDDINFEINKNLVFINSEIMNLRVNQNKFYSCKFQECIINFRENSQKLIITSPRIDIKNCVIEISKNKNTIFRLGELNSSIVNIQNLDFMNQYTKDFKIQIISKDISLNNYISKDGIKLHINNDKSINSIYMRKSKINFVSNPVVDSKMILIEDSNISNVVIESESIELGGKNEFNHVTILKCNDILINEDSNLFLKNTVLKTKLLECSDNSEINDETNRLKWLTNINKINVGKNFKLKYNGITIYEKTLQDYNKNDSEEIVEAVKREKRIR